MLARIVMNLPYRTNSVSAMVVQGGGLTSLHHWYRNKRLAPVYPFLSDYKRVWEMDLAQTPC